jgi:hypothetical protein
VLLCLLLPSTPHVHSPVFIPDLGLQKQKYLEKK